MKAPNKIYLSKLVMAGIESLDKPVSDSDVEYIRKEALLEWLEQVKADPMIPMNIDKVIDKINSL